MKARLLLLFLPLIFIKCGCDDDLHRTIYFKNLSERTIYVIRSSFYPDTVNFVNFNSNPLIYSPSYKIEPGTNNTSLINRSGFEYFFSGKNAKNDTLMVYVFDEEVLKNNEWKKIGEDYLVLQRYDLSLEDLERVNWQLSYPPTVEMKDIKMYPPYSKFE